MQVIGNTSRIYAGEDVAHLDRIRKIQRSGIPSRLLKGARLLGSLWKTGIRCKSGWKQTCGCGSNLTDFCRAKMKWLGLLLESDQAAQFADPCWTGDEDFFVLEAMTLSQAEATSLSVTITADERDPIVIGGPKGTVWKTLLDLAQVPESKPAWDGVVKIQKAFSKKEMASVEMRLV